MTEKYSRLLYNFYISKIKFGRVNKNKTIKIMSLIVKIKKDIYEI